MVACVQCRHRKVRCQGVQSSCDACIRLKFRCSWSQPQSIEESVTSGVPVVTRKRGARACDACRSQKSRCSGDTPCCTRCEQLSLTCNYTLSIHQFRGTKHSRQRAASAGAQSTEAMQIPEEIGSYSAPATGETMANSPAITNPYKLDSDLGCDKTVVRKHIDAFFEHVYPVPLFSFLHRVDFMSQYLAGCLSSTLLLAVCGTAARFVQPDPSMRVQPKVWIERAETTMLQTLGKNTVADVQTLVLLALNRTYNNHSGKTFYYLALAVRMAYSIRLHKEDSGLSFVEQESRRRLLWCIYTMDRYAAGGVPEYTMLLNGSIQVQLPCPEHNFNIDLPISTPHLHEYRKERKSLGLSALLMCLFDVRNRILQYTKHLLDTKSSPETSLEQFKAFEKELREIHESVPEELNFSVRAFQLRALSPERTTFICYHLCYHHCHSELYRLLNPGYREALPQDVIDATPRDLVIYAQSNCLEHAVAIGEMIASTQDLVDTGPYVSDVTCFVVLYQASCAILYACHRDSPAYHMSTNRARRYFSAFIKTLTELLRYFPRYVIFVNDIRNMLRSIDDPHAPFPVQRASAEVDFRARPISSEENSDDDVVASRFSTTEVEAHPSNASIATQPYSTGGDGMIGSVDHLLQAEALFASSWPPYIEDTQYDANFDQSLLWDWTAFLGTNSMI